MPYTAPIGGYSIFAIIKTNFTALHRWKNAPKNVLFLRDYHRHIFNVIVKIRQNHTERDIEYFSFKYALDHYIVKKFNNKKFDYSCETIAEHLYKFISKIYPKQVLSVEVNEDGENGGIIC